jgi:hypothetical protein
MDLSELLADEEDGTDLGVEEHLGMTREYGLGENVNPVHQETPVFFIVGQFLFLETANVHNTV